MLIVQQTAAQLSMFLKFFPQKSHAQKVQKLTACSYELSEDRVASSASSPSRVIENSAAGLQVASEFNLRLHDLNFICCARIRFTHPGKMLYFLQLTWGITYQLCIPIFPIFPYFSIYTLVNWI